MFTTLCLALCPDATYFDGSACVSCSASMPNCTACTSASSCVGCPSPFIRNYDSNVCECPPRLFFNSSVSSCDPCSFDCYTCSGNGTICLTCSNFRELNGSRCSPLPGYYEANTTVPGPCIANCILCSSDSDCSQCRERSTMLSSPVSCFACPFDCWTCDSNGSCLSCSALDFR